MREPREAELALLRRLAAGPQEVNDGPLGRCAKRGWCRSLTARDATGKAIVVFELTDLGRMCLSTAPEPVGPADETG